MIKINTRNFALNLGGVIVSLDSHLSQPILRIIETRCEEDANGKQKHDSIKNISISGKSDIQTFCECVNGFVENFQGNDKKSIKFPNKSNERTQKMGFQYLDAIEKCNDDSKELRFEEYEWTLEELDHYEKIHELGWNSDAWLVDE